MNRIATTSTRAHRRSAPSIAGSFNLVDGAQQRIHELIQRFHTGRWPLFRCLRLRQIEGIVFEAVQWLRVEPPQFAVVKYHRDGHGLSWQRYTSRKAALAALSEACQTA
jgi:hypothetical protein